MIVSSNYLQNQLVFLINPNHIPIFLQSKNLFPWMTAPQICRSAIKNCCSFEDHSHFFHNLAVHSPIYFRWTTILVLDPLRFLIHFIPLVRPVPVDPPTPDHGDELHHARGAPRMQSSMMETPSAVLQLREETLYAVNGRTSKSHPVVFVDS